MAEVWKPIKDFPGYEVSNYGRVKSFRRYPEGQILSPRIDSWGYSQVILQSPKGMQVNKKVHNLVLESFVGSRPDGMQAIHLDENPRNSSLSNLKWGTQNENLKLRYSAQRARITATFEKEV